ncbi:MAG: hypothetical protein KDC83_03475 [Flavobacteriales bacterium]|nr:hypothetical protein [Flavobacteriales bacterium]
MVKLLINLGLFVAVLFLFVTCKKGDKTGNLAPETVIVPGMINLSEDQSLITKVRLAWMGTDPDGYVTHYLVKVGNDPWFSTTKTDSTFLFTIPEGHQYSKITVTVKAVDNSQVEDATPAVLNVPVRNTNPIIDFDFKFSTKDSTIIITSLYWTASDPDGNDNLREIQIRANNGPWTALGKTVKEVHIIPTNPNQVGTTTGKLFDGSGVPYSGQLENLKIGDTNVFHIKAVDLALAESELDTLSGIFIYPKTSDLLFVSGDETAYTLYRNLISKTYKSLDVLNLAVNDGARQPAKWDPTFTLLINQYDKVVFTSDNKKYVNASTGVSNFLLEATAKSILNYFNNDGKIFTIAFLSVDSSLSVTSPIFGAHPISGVSYSKGSAILTFGIPSLIGQESGYPSFQPAGSPAIFPYYPSTDASVIYKGDLQKRGGWEGPEILGTKRGAGSNTSQVFMGVYMYNFSHQPTELEQLFDHVLNKEFNW